MESTNPDALVGLRRRGVACSMDSGCPRIPIRLKLMVLLAAAVEAEIPR